MIGDECDRCNPRFVLQSQVVVYDGYVPVTFIKCRMLSLLRRCRSELVKVVIILVITAILGVSYSVYTGFRCDFEDGQTLVQTPHGHLVKKFDNNAPVKTFSHLSQKCGYENGKINCPDVRHLGETMLRQVQLATIRMLVAFDKISRKHEIKYWLWRGALLGAHRHQGFIPWDNELDIGIMKSDYEKFRMVSHELPSDIFLQNGSSDPAYGKARHTILAKLRDNNGCFGYCARSGCEFHDGMMIDIFGFEETGEGFIVETTKNMVNFDVRKSSIFPLKELKFEGFKIYVPNNHEIILRKLYGLDYNKLPSENTRCPPGRLIGLPWISCPSLASMEAPLKKQYLYISVTSRLKFLSWYF